MKKRIENVESEFVGKVLRGITKLAESVVLTFTDESTYVVESEEGKQPTVHPEVDGEIDPVEILSVVDGLPYEFALDYEENGYWFDDLDGYTIQVYKVEWTT